MNIEEKILLKTPGAAIAVDCLVKKCDSQKWFQVQPHHTDP